MTDKPARTVWETVAVKIPSPWLDLIDEWGALTDKSRSQVLRHAIEIYFKVVRNDFIRNGLIDEDGNRIKPKKGRS